MTRAKVKKLVFEILSEKLGIPKKEIKESSSIVKDLGVDSLDVIELVMSLEESIGRGLSDEEIQKISTVGDIINLVMTLKPETKHYIKPRIQLKIHGNKSKSSLVNKFKEIHSKLLKKMKV